MIKTYLRILIVIILQLSVFAAYSPAQVNTESMRKAGSFTGLKISGFLGFQLKKGNTEYASFTGNLRFDYVRPKYNTFLVSNIQTAEKSGDEFTNEGFLHYRLIYTVDKIFQAEFISQLEYNDALHLKRRELVGAGLRLKAVKNEKIESYVGIGAMYEGEYYSEILESDKKLLRSTNYLTVNWAVSETADFVLTGYFQPDFSNTTDYRILMDSGLDVNITERFSLNLKLNYRFDNDPLPGLENYDIGIISGIGLNI